MRSLKAAAIRHLETPAELICPICKKKPNGVRRDGKDAVYVHKQRFGADIECRAVIWTPPRIKLNIPGYDK